jgi:hypothetical protein
VCDWQVLAITVFESDRGRWRGRINGGGDLLGRAHVPVHDRPDVFRNEDLTAFSRFAQLLLTVINDLARMHRAA